MYVQMKIKDKPTAMVGLSLIFYWFELPNFDY